MQYSRGVIKVTLKARAIYVYKCCTVQKETNVAACYDQLVELSRVTASASKILYPSSISRMAIGDRCNWRM